MHNIIGELFAVAGGCSDVSEHRLCISVIIRESPSSDTDRDTDIFLDRFEVCHVWEKASWCCWVHCDHLIGRRINRCKCKIDTARYISIWQPSYDYRSHSLSQCIQRQIDRLNFMATFACHPRLVVANNLSLQDTLLRFACRNSNIQVTVALTRILKLLARVWNNTSERDSPLQKSSVVPH